jgi:uncharacterized GH25 family protein
MRTIAVVLLLVSSMTVPVDAHDYWLQPQQFFLSKGEATTVKLFVGDHFADEAERSFQSKKTVRFQLISRNQSRDLETAAKDGKKTIATIAPDGPGNHLVVLERDWSQIELSPATFNNYLKHEGLASILESRRKAGEEKTVGRERYRRYLKALVQVGDKSDDTHSRRLGQRLEILLHTNPYQCKQGDSLTASVLFDGKPLQNAQITAYNRASGDTKTQNIKTDDRGRAQIRLDRSGIWLIRLVHMRRCNKVDGIDWESFWAAYTFELK